ncbi:putative dual specificity polyketide synthase [Triangularia setosa]|uniref:Dual specificity polyketide synthase n=1 Tax=Triangularia setosa TaxID=2587417 RepID=A0AAN6VY82_9PEZI|nr:putative dual specificity polyketide synthase [Podospora setosa]
MGTKEKTIHHSPPFTISIKMAIQTPQEPIAIVGTACRFPGASTSTSKLWSFLASPTDIQTTIPASRFNPDAYYHPVGSHHGTTNVRHAYLLSQDLSHFDASFFSISPNEADSIDPQQRLMMETVYEALESGGHSIEALRGSDTSVYVGCMGVDWNDSLLRDVNQVPTYFATGTNRAIIGNRLSFFFDWRGPSMTIDTACSSSLVAVHQGVMSLRSDESRVAVAAGGQVILNPEAFVFESKMNMLSPTGRSRMWDASADGYARGEGVAAIILKKLSDAIADGDHIEGIIRETGVNQDGHSQGLTVPSSEAQAALIRKTYAKAGLDPENNPADRPQFFEAHGTGTKAGDPKEAAAIYECFGQHVKDDDTPLYVGSVKTVIGHTEGAAGLAGFLKGLKSIQAGQIPPNLLFENLNPAIEQYYKGLKVPTALTPWPELPKGVPRRVSVNSFGFGGSNAHAIIEQYIPPTAASEPETDSALFTPFVFSAASESSLVAHLKAYAEYLKTRGDIKAKDLAWTLQSRRSHLPVKAAFSAASVEQLVAKLDDKLADLKRTAGTTVGVRSGSKSTSTPKVLGVFTGQGAQWAAMGAELIKSSEFVRKRLGYLENVLETLPTTDRPTWRLVDELLVNSNTSRIGNAELSQPLCTAIQVVLVDMLKGAGIKFSAVVGHSSGEIGAAYAAGYLSDVDAIRVAYYRGQYARLASNEATGQKGAMLAVGTSLEDAKELCNLRAFSGRLTVAAHNSSASVTLSGDADAVILAKKVFDEEKKFARLLKVDTAYHSHHMLPCGDPYIASLREASIRVSKNSTCAWFSSVIASEKPLEPTDALQDVYWRDNMANTVLFADAVKNAVTSDPQISVAIEVGPHPALKGPVTQNISDVRPTPLPYTGVLSRGKSDIKTFSEALGFVWTQLGAHAVDFASYENLVSPSTRQPKLMVDLPSYRWSHTRSHWQESRKSKKIRSRTAPFHEILGIPCPNSTDREKRWTNILKVSEIRWLDGHQLQGQTVFPAAGYVAMSFEAARTLATEPVSFFELNDLAIPRAITFEENVNSSVETLVTLTNIIFKANITTTFFAVYSSASTESDMELMASGSIKITFGNPSPATLSSTPLAETNMSTVNVDRFYTSLSKLGYGYSGTFRGMSSLKRRLNQASTLVSTYPDSFNDLTPYMVHPTTLDVAFQTSMLAYSAPGDERLWSLHVPTAIRSIRVNPVLCTSPLPENVLVCATLEETSNFSASIDVYNNPTNDGGAMIQVDGLAIKPFAPATEADDHRLFSYTKWDVASPQGDSVIKGIEPTLEEVELAVVCERVSFYYLRKWKKELSDEEWAAGQAHHPALRDFMNYILGEVEKGRQPCVKKEWSNDSDEEVKELIKRYSHTIDIRLLTTVGENIPAAVRGETTILEHMLVDSMLDDFYKKGLGFARYNSFLAAMMEQMVHRYPHAKILEIGAGTGGATKSVLEKIGDKMSSYTYTDISVGFFDKAAELFRAYSGKMTFKVLDVEKPPSSQGYEPHSYDIVVASNVLHATASLQKTLEHVRQLLKPGGYLMLLELTDNGPIRCGNIMGGLPGWWIGAGIDGRKYAPTITPAEWNTYLRKSGFAGVDACTPKINVLPWPFSIMAAQAVDDKVQFLRRPLARSKTSVKLDSLVILGTGSIETSDLVEELEELLSPFANQTTILSGLPTEAEAREIDPMSTIINLADLDFPIFKQITTEKMEGLQRLFQLANHILWITKGAQTDEPYHMASIAFSRAISHEASHINLSHLDLSDLGRNTGRAISEHLLRQCALDEWEDEKIMWSKEPEAFLDGGLLKLPRLVANVSQNSRLNSLRRFITKTLPLASSKSITVALSPDAPPALVEEVRPITKEKRRWVRVEASSLTAVNVALDSFLFVGVGKDAVTQEPLVTLSLSNSIEVNPVASVVAPSLTSATAVLVTITSELIATSLIDNIAPGSSILVHGSNKNRFLTSALSRLTATKNIRTTFTFNAEQGDSAHQGIGLSGCAPRHSIRKMLLPAKPTHFLDLALDAKDSNLSEIIAQVLTSIAPFKRIETSDVSRLACSLPLSSRETVAVRLQEAVSAITSLVEGTDDLVVPVTQIRVGSSLLHHPTAVVDWAVGGTVSVGVKPLDAEQLFGNNKSYLLLGLSGQIGQSVAEWMVKNGAGCVCLTSRSPKIDPKWLEEVQSTGAIVKIYAMDVTEKSSLEKVVADIRFNCPPIAGVANGAMVLHDSLFSNMPLETMQKVLGPKIDGSNHLDDVFYNEDLDFFMLLSSSACVIGNSGQSNYAASNGYLNGLARQRRKRGLAASALDIGRVAGLGYVETAGQAVMDQLTRFGLMSIAESEFHQMFAEAIQAGFPKPEDKHQIPDAVVTTGIRIIRDDEDIQGPWFNNSRFSHCIVEAKGTKSDGQGEDKKTSLPVTIQLAGASTKDEALEILQESFSSKLRIILQISDKAIDPEAPLVELGVDSLVAVEVRSWFLKELKVDIPVLKVVGGASVCELCQRAMDKLPEEILSGLGKAGSESKPKSATKKTQPKLEPKPESKVGSAAASEYDSTAPSMVTAAGVTTVLGSSTQLSSRSTSPENLAADATKQAAIVAAPPASLKFIKSEQISFGQSRFWFLRLLVEDPTTFNVAFYYRVTGALRVGSLERAIRVLTARHEALRTCFVADQTEADQAYQKVIASSPLRLEHKQISSEQDVAIEYAKLKAHEFNLAAGESMKLVLLSKSTEDHFLLFNYHHIVMDGVSFQVFLSDLEKAYNNQSLGKAPRQFPDFSTLQRQAFESGDMSAELKYWRGIFPEGQQPPVLPLLPMARTGSRLFMQNFDIHQVGCHLKSALVARIKTISKAQRSTPFHFYLAAFKTMLFLFTEADDLTIGIADANRTDSDVITSIGFFLNLLTLRFRRQPSQKFSDAINEARNTTYSALANSRLPFDVLLKELNITRSSAHSPFFQAFFDYRQGAQEKHVWGNCQFEVQELHPGRTAYDITLDVTESSADALVMFRAQKSLYDRTGANVLMETYVHLLDVLSSDVSLSLSITPLFGEKQLEDAVNIGRGPHLVSDWPLTLAHRIDQVAFENPDKIALKDGHENVLTYSDMINRIEAIAEALQDAGVGAGSRVPVFQDAAAHWVCSMLAIFRVGAIYIPLDLRNPISRLAAVAIDCESTAILVDKTTFDQVPQLNVPDAAVVNVSSLPHTASKPIPNAADAKSPAAILYTSGSTGLPKGIIVTHAGLRNEIEGYSKMWKLGRQHTLQQSAFTFNHSSDQIYTGLVNGGSVYVVPWAARGDPIGISSIIKNEGITYTKATPSEYSLWMQYGQENLRQAVTWQFAFGGGEPLVSTVTKEFAALELPQLKFFNSYGPTEISISSHKMEMPYHDAIAIEAMGRIPCGYSLPNYSTYIVDQQLKPVPIGIPGEVCLGGAGVSLGYLNNDDLTTKHFVSNPFAAKTDVASGWTRMYRTGDIGHLQTDGAMVFHSRMAGDTQIKIRGLRIELADIESNIVTASDGALREAVVNLREGNPDFLIAHVVFAPQSNVPDKEAFLQHLLGHLQIPQYMVPSAAIPLDKLPLTNHSKVDRKALQTMPLPQRASTTSHKDGKTEMTETMIQLRRVWQDVLGHNNESSLSFDIAPSTSFFMVGGNSLLVIRLQSRIRQTFNVVIRLVDLLGSNILSAMARKIEETPSVLSMDWDSETLPPTTPSFLSDIPPTPIAIASKTILITGGTGFLSRHLLPIFSSDPAISKIHVIAIRNSKFLPFSSPKIILHAGDLSSPLLGLSESDFTALATTVDVILHLGAVRSFWDNYYVLKPSNLHPTNELIKLAVPRQIPIHYISTIGVLPPGLQKETSAKYHLPPVDGSNGYVATRWASEQVLERSGLPVSVYRFLPASGEQTDAGQKRAVLEEFLTFVDLSRKTPDFRGWEGKIDLIRTVEVAGWLSGEVVRGDDGNDGGARFRHYQSSVEVTVEELRRYIAENTVGEREVYETMAGLGWIGLIKKLGFGYFFSGQDATIGREKSRR